MISSLEIPEIPTINSAPIVVVTVSPEKVGDKDAVEIALGTELSLSSTASVDGTEDTVLGWRLGRPLGAMDMLGIQEVIAFGNEPGIFDGRLLGVSVCLILGSKLGNADGLVLATELGTELENELGASLGLLLGSMMGGFDEILLWRRLGEGVGTVLG